MNAQSITALLGGHWHGRYGTAPCPICQPEGRRGQDALTLNDGDGRLLLDCKKSGCNFRDILAARGITPGTFTPPDPALLAQRKAEALAEEAKRAGQAKRIWNAAMPITGTLAETYLRGRGITCDLPESLRFHPECWHSETSKRHPAMIGRVQHGNGFAVHRTYLAPDGSGKAAVKTAKAMLGAVGGGAVPLSKGGPVVVAEGIETALSLMSGLLPYAGTVVAALSASNLKGLRLPPESGEMVIASDGDPAGRGAALALAERAHALGWGVRMFPAPEGRDWNDVLTAKGGAA